MTNTNDDSNGENDFTAQLKERLGNPAIFILLLASMSTYRRELYELFLASKDRTDYAEALKKLELFNPDLWITWTIMLAVYYSGVYFGGLLSAIGEKLKRHAAISMDRFTPLPESDRKVLQGRISALKNSEANLKQELIVNKDVHQRLIEELFVVSLRGRVPYPIRTFLDATADKDLMIWDRDSNRFVTDQPFPVSNGTFDPYLVLFKTENSFIGMRLLFRLNKFEINGRWHAGNVEVGAPHLAKQFPFTRDCNVLYMPNTEECKWQQAEPTDGPYLVLEKTGTQDFEIRVSLSFANHPGRYVNSP